MSLNLLESPEFPGPFFAAPTCTYTARYQPTSARISLSPNCLATRPGVL